MDRDTYSNLIFRLFIQLKGHFFFIFGMKVPLDLIFLTASLRCFGLTGWPASPTFSILARASSMTSPANTLAMPAMAITTFCPTLHPVMVCMIFLTVVLGRAALLYMAYLSNWSSVNWETNNCIFSRSSAACSALILSMAAWGVVGVSRRPGVLSSSPPLDTEAAEEMFSLGNLGGAGLLLLLLDLSQFGDSNSLARGSSGSLLLLPSGSILIFFLSGPSLSVSSWSLAPDWSSSLDLSPSDKLVSIFVC